MTMRTMPRLAQELVDIIIDDIAESDQEDLKQCSLVSRNWLPRCSKHILRSVAWPPRRVREWKECCVQKSRNCKCLTPEQRSFATCAHTLSSSPRLQSFVRTILLLSVRCPCKNTESTGDEALDPMTAAAIMNGLPNLETLVINAFPSIHHGLSPSVRPCPPLLKGNYRVETLRFIGAPDDATLINVPALLSIFSSVQRLEFDRFASPIEIISQSSQFAVPQIGYLDMLHDRILPFAHVLCRQLVSQPNLSFLRSLACVKITPAIRTLICAAPNLESLAFREIDTITPPFESGQCLAPLSTVSICYYFPTRNAITLIEEEADEERRSLLIWAQFRKHLDLLTSFDLRTIVLSLHVDSPGSSEHNDPTLYNDVYTSSHEALSTSPDTQSLNRTLQSFTSLEDFVVEIDFTRSRRTKAHSRFYHSRERCAILMTGMFRRALSQQYIDMLQVREVF